MHYNYTVSFIRKLIWDGWNVDHIARHKVIPEEVENVCHCNPLVQAGKKGRKLIIGPTRENRIITIILEHEGYGKYYPVTARDASRKERKLYKKEKEVHENEKNKKQNP